MSPETAFVDMLSAYHDINGVQVDEIYKVPSPLEYLRYVGRSRPFILRQVGLRDWPALQRWSVSYLKERMGDAVVNIAVTPNGSAIPVSTHSLPRMLTSAQECGCCGNEQCRRIRILC